MGVHGTAFKHGPRKHNTQANTLSKWAHGRQNTSLQAKKAEAEVERHKKAAALRKYAKLCKAEGVQSARVNVQVQPPAASDTGSAAGQSRQEKRAARDEQRREKKGQSQAQAPFQKERRQHGEAQKVKQEEEARKAANEQAVREKAKAREEKKKLHLKRTSKGQPLMNGRVKSLLAKIEKTMGQ